MAPDDATVRLITLEGFRVDCAPSAAVGLAMLRTGWYDGILLDLRLGDMPGLDVLGRLKAEAVAIPVLVLTGHPDVQSAVAAMRRGAWDFQSKTILLDEEWKDVFQRLVEAGKAQRTSSVARNTPDIKPSRCDQDSQLLRELIDRLDALTRVGAGARLDELMGPLVCALIKPDLSNWCFLGCAKAFRQVVTASAAIPLTELAGRARDVLVDLERRVREPLDPLLRMAMKMLETPAADWSRRSEDEVAKAIDLSASQVAFYFREGPVATSGRGAERPRCGWRWARSRAPTNTSTKSRTEWDTSIRRSSAGNLDGSWA